ncbi:GNAT family N-acetyltransferase [Magnetococcus sp. PR-3]|uniref:GNAT family N-acetyltransferase n=1 Tax=Magnetococcus sp. PR-3 TaxID=3120355 RepID=UPI002FCE565A
MTPLCHGLRLNWGSRQDLSALSALYREALLETQPMETLRIMASPGGGGISRLVHHGSILVGHTLFLPIDIKGEGLKQAPRFMGLASLLVHPEYRERGIGSMLVEDGIRACTARGHEALYSATLPDFLMRFGFLPFQGGKTGQASKLWMRPLSYSGLQGWQGDVQFHPMILNPLHTTTAPLSSRQASGQ